MSKVEELCEWAKREATDNGLVDVRFFPGVNPDAALEDAAAAALSLLNGGLDIGDEGL